MTSNVNRWLLPDGVDEVLPPRADQLETLRREILDLYRSWGYDLIKTPLIEFLDSLLIIQMFPAALTVIALYTIFDALGNVTPILGVDSHWSLILSYLSALTLHIWTIKGYFDSIDPAMDKAAQIDGATPWQTFRHVFLPMSVPILAVVFVLAFIFLVTEYPAAAVLLRETDNMTLAVGARQYLYEQRYLWGDFAAAAILSGLPITLVFLVAQRYLVSGLTEGGVKG